MARKKPTVNLAQSVRPHAGDLEKLFSSDEDTEQSSGLQLVDEPEALLRQRDRRDPLLSARTDTRVPRVRGCAAGALLVDPGRQAAGGRMLEHRGERYGQPGALRQPRHEARGQQ